MSLLHKVDLTIFLISFIIGLIVVYFITPLPTIVYKYPTPYNTENVVYENQNSVCYKYNVNKVNCPK